MGQQRVKVLLGSNRAARGFQMILDHFACSVFARAAAIRDGQTGLDITQARCTAIYALADLAITDSVAKTDVHRCHAITGWSYLNTNANDCQLSLCLIRRSPVFDSNDVTAFTGCRLETTRLTYLVYRCPFQLNSSSYP